MSNKDAISNVNARHEAIIVRAPRAGDRIAFALSAAFDCHDGLPDDWQSILAQLDSALRVQPRR